MNISERLRVFVGSSRESLPVVRILETRLSSDLIQVIPWDVDDFEVGGRFFLDQLLNAPEEYDFDFAIFVFGPDDEIVSRGETFYTPRDNVLFELGIFMSKLGRERTFVIAPKPWKAKLKMLSDFANYTPHYYDPPEKARTIEQRRQNLEQKLERVIGVLLEDVKRQQHRNLARGPEHVHWVSHTLDAFLRSAPKSRTIKNVALDLGATWNIYHALLERPTLRDINVQTLMMDGYSKPIQEASAKTPRAEVARMSEQSVVEYCTEHAGKLSDRGITFQCRAYAQVPFVHGFLLDKYKLLISVCAFEHGKLIGTPNPYLELDYRPVAARDTVGWHFFRAFETFFDTQWELARHIWPPAK